MSASQVPRSSPIRCVRCWFGGTPVGRSYPWTVYARLICVIVDLSVLLAILICSVTTWKQFTSSTLVLLWLEINIISNVINLDHFRYHEQTKQPLLQSIKTKWQGILIASLRSTSLFLVIWLLGYGYLGTSLWYEQVSSIAYLRIPLFENCCALCRLASCRRFPVWRTLYEK